MSGIVRGFMKSCLALAHIELVCDSYAAQRVCPHDGFMRSTLAHIFANPFANQYEVFHG